MNCIPHNRVGMQLGLALVTILLFNAYELKIYSSFKRFEISQGLAVKLPLELAHLPQLPKVNSPKSDKF